MNKVNIGKEYSEPIDQEFSVPQGSCASPILVLLYASTTAEVVPPSIDIHGYVDDHEVKAVSRMQRVQNIASHMVLYAEQDPGATKCLQKLHWLPIQQQIKFKILTLVCKCLNKQAPSYLSNLLTINPISDQSMHSNS